MRQNKPLHVYMSKTQTSHMNGTLKVLVSKVTKKNCLHLVEDTGSFVCLNQFVC